MTKRKAPDPVVAEIERALMPGQFIRYDEMHEFIGDLEKVEGKLKALVRDGEAERAVHLYEVFLSGCYEKIEQCDDSGAYLSMFFGGLFCGWVKARPAAGRRAEETVRQILRWKEHDDYGFCHDIEKDVAKVLDHDGYRLLVGHFEAHLAKALPDSASKPSSAIFEYGNDVRLPALSLKGIYESKQDAKSYAAVCDRVGLSPRDCERLAEMEVSKGHWDNALGWVERGLALEPTRNWHNESSYGLAHLKPKILGKLGRKEDALALAWADFEKSPSEFAYGDLMRYVPKAEKAQWRERAIETAGRGDMGDFLTLCVKTKEWDRVAARVHAADHAELESLSHYHSEPAADGLAKRDARAAAKLYRALCLRILTRKKSKYYGAALDHIERARELYLKVGEETEWRDVVEAIRTAHSRKSGFLAGFERIVAGCSPAMPSFAERARRRWAKQSS